jgi:hemoglobin
MPGAAGCGLQARKFSSERSFVRKLLPVHLAGRRQVRAFPARSAERFSVFWGISMIDQLYETIGGRQTVQAAIASFYRRVLRDETLRHFFNSTDMTKLRAGQSMFLSMLVGGKVVYTGKDMGAAHAQARANGLTDEHFDRFLQHFRDALDEVGVKPDNAEKVVQLLEAKRDIVLNR